MSLITDNAVIMAAGTSSRFAPLSYERPKALIEVRGEILLERQIRQLKEAGIDEIFLVCGYKKEQFEYLKKKFGIQIADNPDYLTRNNNSSIWAVKEQLGNTYICSSDNYFTVNPFEKNVSEAYYSAVYADGETAEWCMEEDAEGYISSVQIGGRDAWYMLGHAYWDKTFSEKFRAILEEIYDLPQTADMLWEAIYMRHLDELKLKMRKYEPGVIFEFDTLDELREFDKSYEDNTRSQIIRSLCERLHVSEREIRNAKALKTTDNAASGMSFTAAGKQYEYIYSTDVLKEI
ncbi:MAG: NTP transferase domain-containing protein [Solobacterium sp.]|nr:NTP transferase domain-containing protein [Solobacterium sp.]